MTEFKPCKSTPPEDLYKQLLDPSISKTEREHFAARRLKELVLEKEDLLEDIGLAVETNDIGLLSKTLRRYGVDI